MGEKKKDLIGFKVTKRVKDLISKFANSSGQSVSDVVREATLDHIRGTEQFSFADRLDTELNELQTEAEKQAQAEVLGSDYVQPGTYEEKIQEEKNKLEKLKNKLTMADRATMEAIRDQVAGEGDLDNVEDPTWDLERKINKSETTINKLKELKVEAEKLQNQVGEKAEAIFVELVKEQLVKPVAQETEQVLSKLIEDLRLLDELMEKSHIWRKGTIGWQIQSRIDKGVPFFDSPFSRHPTDLEATIPEIFGLD